MLITTSPAAKILSTSEHTVRALARKGVLPCIQTSTGMRLYHREMVEQLAIERQAQRDAAREERK